jgi:hypothetical protein
MTDVVILDSHQPLLATMTTDKRQPQSTTILSPSTTTKQRNYPLENHLFYREYKENNWWWFQREYKETT